MVSDKEEIKQPRVQSGAGISLAKSKCVSVTS